MQNLAARGHRPFCSLLSTLLNTALHLVVYPTESNLKNRHRYEPVYIRRPRRNDCRRNTSGRRYLLRAAAAAVTCPDLP